MQIGIRAPAQQGVDHSALVSWVWRYFNSEPEGEPPARDAEMPDQAQQTPAPGKSLMDALSGPILLSRARCPAPSAAACVHVCCCLPACHALPACENHHQIYVDAGDSSGRHLRAVMCMSGLGGRANDTVLCPGAQASCRCTSSTRATRARSWASSAARAGTRPCTCWCWTPRRALRRLSARCAARSAGRRAPARTCCGFHHNPETPFAPAQPCLWGAAALVGAHAWAGACVMAHGGMPAAVFSKAECNVARICSGWSSAAQPRYRSRSTRRARRFLLPKSETLAKLGCLSAACREFDAVVWACDLALNAVHVSLPD